MTARKRNHYVLKGVCILVWLALFSAYRNQQFSGWSSELFASDATTPVAEAKMPGAFMTFPLLHDERTVQAFIMRQPHDLDTSDIKKLTGDFVSIDSYNVPRGFPPHGYWLKFEGPTWENDHVGYRFYCDERHRFDIFGKRTSDLVLDTVALDYHELQPWGSDILKVGSTFGIGSPAIEIEGQVYFFEEWKTKVMEVRNKSGASEIVAKFTGLMAGDYQFDVTQTLTMYPNNPYTRSEIKVKPVGKAPDYRVVSGIVQHEAASLGDLKKGKWHAMYTYGAQSFHDHDMGMALMSSKEYNPTMGEDAGSYTLVMEPVKNKVVYYFMADWSLGVKGSKDEDAFVSNLALYSDDILNH